MSAKKEADEQPEQYDGYFIDKTGNCEPARMYREPGDNRPFPEHVDANYARWNDSSGVLCFRKGASVISVGASKSYSGKYDSVDWGN